MPEEKKKHKLGAIRDDGQPALGMKFEDSRSKLLKYKSSRANPYLKESLIRQVENHEGKDAGLDLRKEINFKYDEEKKIKPLDFIHNPNGRLMSRGFDNGKGKIYAWCNECGERCYVYTVIKDDFGHSLSRCSKCGTNCLELNEDEYELKQEEYNGKKR